MKASFQGSLDRDNHTLMVNHTLKVISVARMLFNGMQRNKKTRMLSSIVDVMRLDSSLLSQRINVFGSLLTLELSYRKML